MTTQVHFGRGSDGRKKTTAVMVQGINGSCRGGFGRHRARFHSSSDGGQHFLADLLTTMAYLSAYSAVLMHLRMSITLVAGHLACLHACRVRQFELRGDGADPAHPEARSLLNRVVESGGLADAAFADDAQHLCTPAVAARTRSSSRSRSSPWGTTARSANAGRRSSRKCSHSQHAARRPDRRPSRPGVSSPVLPLVPPGEGRPKPGAGPGRSRRRWEGAGTRVTHRATQPGSSHKATANRWDGDSS